jgi:hypothetical protein
LVSLFTFFAACSRYFEKIFEQSEKLGKCFQQQLVINEVPYDVLQSVLEFAYTGEVTIKSEDYERFLQAANLLKLKGLGGNDSLFRQNLAASPVTPLAASPATPPTTPPATLSPEVEKSTPPLPELSLESGILDAMSETSEATVKSEPLTPVVEKKRQKRKLTNESLGEF